MADVMRDGEKELAELLVPQPDRLQKVDEVLRWIEEQEKKEKRK